MTETSPITAHGTSNLHFEAYFVINILIVFLISFRRNDR